MPLFTSRPGIAITGAIALGSSPFAVIGTAHAHRGSADLGVIKQAVLSVKKQKSYRMLMKSTSESGKTTTRTLEALPAQHKYHMLGGAMEMIIVPGATYSHRNGAWKRLPMDMSKSMSEVTDEALKDADKSTTVKRLGPALWKGSSTTIYALETHNEDVNSTGKVWIRASDGLPLHAESTVNLPRQSFAGKTFGGKSTSVIDYDYTTPVTITAPAAK